MKQPRPYQLDCFDAVKSAYLHKLRRVIVVLATGLGKTVIFVLLTLMTRSKDARSRVLILVNRDVLCQQAFDELKQNGMHPVLERGQDKASSMSDLVVGSIQTMVGERLKKWNRDHFKLVVCDECQGSAAGTFREALEYFKSAYHLGVTATPNRHDKKGLWSGYEKIVYEMPLKTRTEGDTVTAGGIDEGWLCDLRFREIPVPIVLDDKLALKKTITEDEESGEYGLQSHLERIYEATAPELVGRKALNFFPNCLSSIEAAKAFVGYGLNARHIEGPGGPAGMSKAQIKETLEWFANEKEATLCNSELLSVGYNQPDIDLIGLVRLIKSETAYLQKLGRGTRVVANVDALTSRDERLAAIEVSAKPFCTVLDLCIQNEDHNLCNPAILVTSNPEEQAELRAKRKQSGKLIDMDSLDTLLKAKRVTDRDKMLAAMSEQVANAAEKKRMLAGDGPYIGHILSKRPEKHWKPASDAQTSFVRALGYKGTLPSGWHASRIIDTYKKHAMKGELV